MGTFTPATITHRRARSGRQRRIAGRGAENIGQHQHLARAQALPAQALNLRSAALSSACTQPRRRLLSSLGAAIGVHVLRHRLQRGRQWGMSNKQEVGHDGLGGRLSTPCSTPRKKPARWRWPVPTACALPAACRSGRDSRSRLATARAARLMARPAGWRRKLKPRRRPLRRVARARSPGTQRVPSANTASAISTGCPSGRAPVRSARELASWGVAPGTCSGKGSVGSGRRCLRRRLRNSSGRRAGASGSTTSAWAKPQVLPPAAQACRLRSHGLPGQRDLRCWPRPCRETAPAAGCRAGALRASPSGRTGKQPTQAATQRTFKRAKGSSLGLSRWQPRQQHGTCRRRPQPRHDRAQPPDRGPFPPGSRDGATSCNNSS
jgi:hypothetical protein